MSPRPSWRDVSRATLIDRVRVATRPEATRSRPQDSSSIDPSADKLPRMPPIAAPGRHGNVSRETGELGGHARKTGWIRRRYARHRANQLRFVPTPRQLLAHPPTRSIPVTPLSSLHEHQTGGRSLRPEHRSRAPRSVVAIPEEMWLTSATRLRWVRRAPPRHPVFAIGPGHTRHLDVADNTQFHVKHRGLGVETMAHPHTSLRSRVNGGLHGSSGMLGRCAWRSMGVGCAEVTTLIARAV